LSYAMKLDLGLFNMAAFPPMLATSNNNREYLTDRAKRRHSIPILYVRLAFGHHGL
jgi:hypothetical protein